MSYATAVLAREGSRWVGDELDLSGAEDLDAVVERLHDVAGEDANPVLLFVEEDDEWFAVVRLDADGDPRVFLSDERAIATSEVAAVLGEGAADPDTGETPDSEEVAADEEESSARIEGDPVGDPALLADLGTSSARLLEMCAAEGQLPSDVISDVCEAAGCLEVFEELRGA